MGALRHLIKISFLFLYSTFTLASVTPTVKEIITRPKKNSFHGILQLDTATHISPSEKSAKYSQRFNYIPIVRLGKQVYGASIFSSKTQFENKSVSNFYDSLLFVYLDPVQINPETKWGLRIDAWLPTSDFKRVLGYYVRPGLTTYIKWKKGRYKGLYEPGITQLIYRENNPNTQYILEHKVEFSVDLTKNSFLKTRMKYSQSWNAQKQQKEHYRWSQSFGYKFQRNFFFEVGHSLRNRLGSYSKEENTFKLYDKSKSKYFASVFYIH